MKSSCLIIFLTLFSLNLSGQTKVAITIDDVPSSVKYQNDKYKLHLLTKLDSLNIPATIFVTVGLLYKTDSSAKNTQALNEWISRDNITIGYHSFSHFKYSSISLDSFKNDFERGEKILKDLVKKYNKPINYFRFPFNDLGGDSTKHVEAARYLSSKHYRIAPFTVESEDWMFNYIYEYYLNRKDFEKAKEIAKEYISKSLAYFEFFDSLALKKYGRRINQLYLCHDNTINADYLPELINELKKRNYRFVSFEEALKDEAYNQEDNYFKSWGISWFYRWMKSQKEINFYSGQEPFDETYKLYEQLVKEQKIIK